ncbi:hypothetical protein TTHERM_000001241 (macronuclear) [Tetrahymena thermophila SB210]|uniref:Uncharacterized protein n=1 Tax=Tetrahymena thermophila (strain SB210) TaxID=312017 RepID=W7XGW1_TETTS|nr:hypothetical protein TTHERM_000001241 [Tetrahymena thermophila SB210]EWS76288.1 hypothetical protein TTHERM_000001241 [Tetrahymena thermophila SB210]|eukprot:XP_012651072.1 hypothetical protein TTHERM_000001241 [Tetrahymena thermophila SB210]
MGGRGGQKCERVYSRVIIIRKLKIGKQAEEQEKIRVIRNLKSKQKKQLDFVRFAQKQKRNQQKLRMWEESRGQIIVDYQYQRCEDKRSYNIRIWRQFRVYFSICRKRGMRVNKIKKERNNNLTKMKTHTLKPFIYIYICLCIYLSKQPL